MVGTQSDGTSMHWACCGLWDRIPRIVDGVLIIGVLHMHSGRARAVSSGCGESLPVC